jgi:glycosyltransferase involved in cell wall biosynthesis
MQSISPRRILHVTRIEEGGVARVVEDLVTGFDKDLFEPIVLCKSSVDTPFKRRLSNAGVKILSLYDTIPSKIDSKEGNLRSRDIGAKLEKKFNSNIADAYFSIKSFKDFIVKQAPEIRLFLKVFRDCKPHLVHTHHNTSMGKAEIVASALSGLSCISHRHGYNKLSAFDIFFSLWIDSNIYISHDVAKSYISQGESKPSSNIIHNGIDIEHFKPIDSSIEVRKEFNLNSNELLVGIVGRIDWWKGYEFFLNALSIVKNFMPNVKAIIVGDLETNSMPDRNRHYMQNLKKLVRSLGIVQDVIFTGHRDDIPSLLNAMDVFVHASSEPEPFGLVIIEAMAAGKPVIATAAGGVLDIVDDKKNGLLVPLKDSDTMSKAILDLLSNKDYAKLLGNAARKHVKVKFGLRRQVEAVQKLYEKHLIKPKHQEFQYG